MNSKGMAANAAVSFFLFFMEIDMKKKLILSETDIKAVMAEKFKVDPDDINIYVYKNDGNYPGLTVDEVRVEITSEVQNYDV